MDSNRKEHIIDGTVFLVDITKLSLAEKGRPDNVIPYQFMDYKDSHYEIDYDRIRKNVAFVGSLEKDIIHVTIPSFGQLDPEGMAERFGKTVSEISGTSDFELLVGEKVFAERQAGILPSIPIGTDLFTVDMRLQEIRHNGGMHGAIKFQYMDVAEDGDHFVFLYDKINKGLYDIDYKMLRIPDNVFLVTIPNEVSLDPYGLARLSKIDEREFMFHHPPPKELKSTAVPAKDTWLAKLVETNREAYNKGHHNATDHHSKKQGL